MSSTIVDSGRVPKALYEEENNVQELREVPHAFKAERPWSFAQSSTCTVSRVHTCSQVIHVQDSKDYKDAQLSFSYTHV